MSGTAPRPASTRADASTCGAPDLDHITVCICTYRRPALLERLLDAVCRQVTAGEISYSIVVVDNDAARSAHDVVDATRTTRTVDIVYDCEPEQNISRARNRAVLRSRGELLALVDDDECPAGDWLITLYRTYRRYAADGVLGPVRPRFLVDPPTWIVAGRILERETFATGTVVRDARYLRSGNVLLRRSLVAADDAPFDPRFGRTGGEDTAFFTRKLAEGRRFVWCDEAPVFEAVPAERLTRRYLLKRALLRGVTRARLGRPRAGSLLRSAAAVVLYGAALPLLCAAGHHHVMRVLIKQCDHVGKLLAVCGLAPVRERDWHDADHPQAPPDGAEANRDD